MTIDAKGAQSINTSIAIERLSSGDRPDLQALLDERVVLNSSVEGSNSSRMVEINRVLTKTYGEGAEDLILLRGGAQHRTPLERM